MNKNQALQKPENAVLAEPSSRWFAALTSRAPVDLPGQSRRIVAGDGRSRTLYLACENGSALPTCAERAGCGVIFDGVLFNRGDLQDELGEFLAPDGSNDAEVVLAGYLRWGEDLLTRVRGAFALVVWDSLREVLLCTRDQLGTYPMFHADGGDQLFVSTSIDVLLRQPNISRAVNRAAMADYLVDRFPSLEETFFEAVSRVPPGHVLRVAREGRSSYRYWDPAPNGEVNWLTRDEVGRFDELLDRAVGRCLSFGSAGIFLSGGLDSVTVAAVAAELCRAEGHSKPWALSLVFPDAEANEEIVQRSVATQLGLPQVVKPFFEATGAKGLLAPALEMSTSLPAPLMNNWLPAYYELAREGKRRGCQTILTGNGGDEWLTITPFLAADLLRSGNLLGIYRLWQSQRRSYGQSSLAILRSMLWRFGAQPLVVPPVHRVVKQVAPWAIRMRHRLSRRPPHWVTPKWVAPDPALRRELDQRVEARDANKARTQGSFYIREMRTAFDHPIVSWELEEIFNIYQRAGVRVLQPFWDPDLVDQLCRTPPFLLNHDNRSKGLVRASLARRFPTLGFERQKKVGASQFYASVVHREAGKIWQQIGSAKTLVDLGIVDEKASRFHLEQLLAKRTDGRQAFRVWVVLNLESWARSHVS